MSGSSCTLFAAAAFMLLLTPPAARAGAIDTLSLTPSGPDTVFTITGTYTPGTPTTPFSAPNTPYSLTFTLATTPSSLAFVDVPDALFGIDATAMLNGFTFNNSQILFSEGGSNGPGGLVVCLGQACNPITLSPDFWDIAGSQLFSGTLSNPTFGSGSATIDFATSGYQISSTPEPASLLLLGTGLLGLAAAIRFRLA